MGSNEYVPLFETKEAKGRVLYRLYAGSVAGAICLVWTYRLSHMPREGEGEGEGEGEEGRWVWIGLVAAELWFSVYWVFTQAARWNRVYRFPFKDRLSHRYENNLPQVDIFVCTANPMIEPPAMVINTVLSVMAYDYPSEKLSVYLSDDGGSVLTFYALLEASKFARQWIPFCNKFKVEPTSPSAYFRSNSSTPPQSTRFNMEFGAIKKLYEEMEARIETATRLGRIPEEARYNHKGFSEWDSSSSQRDHGTILQILMDGKDVDARDADGFALPTLVYLAREKRPQHPHNFKAGAMNALIRVSSKISNGDVILNVDCDMYSNDSLSVRDALCFFMDEKKSHDIAFVQFPQDFDNITKNDVYGSLLLVPRNVELHGMDGFGGPLYIGTGCFHRRDALCGRKFTKDCKFEWNRDDGNKKQQSVHEIEEEAKPLASSTYEQNTAWGNEMGLKYGCPVEDVITGLSIHCKGWKSVYLNPERKAFLGIAPTTLPQSLLQHKRWSEGHLQVFLSKHSPAYANGKISLGLQLGYCIYNLWALNCLATLYYTIFPSVYLLKGISLYPQVSSPWLLPFAYVISAKYIYSLAEYLSSGGTLLGWWNAQRMWLYLRTSSFLFAFIDTTLKKLGFTDSTFVITAKVADEDVLQRYEKEMMEFGTSSPMFTVLATLAMLNLVCFVGVMKKVILSESTLRHYYETRPCQFLLCGSLVLINWPLYQGLFLRKDKGKLPGSLAVKSFVFAFILCTSFRFL
ncbi:cellulose synthase-like protein E1 [Ricinus communis]|uniref:cellulose synthase-like protein E1 n=1 Tax=Ricinus communis TaxID=3988 RepID=UPI0007723127|nr:cellulose synthase-like protein E1 [Ricinus communis]|eukprot:XP_015576998.1 cellulose synthase-like protein E1 [Ricinus communis]